MFMQELLALPAITPGMLAKFETDVAATNSEKEQRLIIRKLLMQAGLPFPCIGSLHHFSGFSFSLLLSWPAWFALCQAVFIVPTCPCLHISMTSIHVSLRHILLLSGVDDLNSAWQLNFKPVVAATVNVSNYEQRSTGKQLPVDQQGGDMGITSLTQ